MDTRSRAEGAVSRLSVATLVRSVPVQLVEVSQGGCRLTSHSRVDSGTSGLLAVELAGLLRIDDVRIARCQQHAGAGAVYHLGAELLRTRRLGRRSLRTAMTTIIGEGRDVGRVQAEANEPPPVGVRTKGMGGRFESRAPPAHSDNGP